MNLSVVAACSDVKVNVICRLDVLSRGLHIHVPRSNAIATHSCTRQLRNQLQNCVNLSDVSSSPCQTSDFN